MKFKYIVVYQNKSDKFNIGHCRIKVNTGVQIFPNLPQYKLSGPRTQL